MRFIIVLFAVYFIAGCSDSNEETPFEGRWVLTDYTLDDGTMRSVPDDIQSGGGIGLFVSSIESLTVSSGLCDSYQSSYQLDNDVLSTRDPIFPDVTCAGFYADEDNTERTELISITFLNSQTLINITNDGLVVTTTNNETLNFMRPTM